MEVKAIARQIRISPRKTRLVVDLVRGLKVEAALGQLKFSKKKAAEPIAKLISSAAANAEHNFELDRDNLFVKEIRADEGATLKRWLPRAYGRATPLRKRSSHISVILAEIADSGKKTAKKQEIEAPIKLDAMSAAKEPEDGKKLETTGKKEKAPEGTAKEKGKKIIDPRMEGRRGHAKIEGEGGTEGKGFINKVFRRKSG